MYLEDVPIIHFSGVSFYVCSLIPMFLVLD